MTAVDMPKTRVEALRCVKCDHIWVPRRGRGSPKVCPVCKSTEWNGGTK